MASRAFTARLISTWLKLPPIGDDRAQERSGGDRHVNVLAQKPAEQSPGILDHLPQIEHRGLHDLLSCEREELLGE
jgi:hypothetical protein